MFSYIDYVYSIGGDIITKRVVNLISKKVGNKYTEEIQPKNEDVVEEEEEEFVLSSGMYIVIEYGSKYLDYPLRQTTIQIPNT
tara:strand:- start:236 stop:484 length:249 start_codon:yes stop_codon:yes gene_type:complete